MVEKMEGFLGAIATVNGITHHGTLVDGNISASEFTFDFDMKDESKILWHEIIQRTWGDDGKYFLYLYNLELNAQQLWMNEKNRKGLVKGANKNWKKLSSTYN